MSTESASATAPIVFADHGKIVTTSIAVAEYFGKQHKDVLRAIEKLKSECPEEFTERNFAPSEYTDPTGRKLPCYELSRDGFTMLAMGFTGQKALQWKLKYLEAFNRLEAELTQKALPTDLITPAQQRALQELVKQRAHQTGTILAYIWSRFNNHYKLGSYKQLPAARFDEARAYLEAMPLKAEPKPSLTHTEAPEALPAELQAAIDRRAHACSYVAYQRYRKIMSERARAGRLPLEEIETFEPDTDILLLQLLSEHFGGIWRATRAAVKELEDLEQEFGCQLIWWKK